MVAPVTRSLLSTRFITAVQVKLRTAAQESRATIDMLLVGAPSDRHLGSYFDHAPGRDLEIVGSIVGYASEQDEETILPAWHA